MAQTAQTDPRARAVEAAAQRGSALVLALLVVFILTLLGTSFLMMAQTESAIVRNERLAIQARYVAEAGALAVKGWFDRPGTATGFPPLAVVDLAQREILDPADPYGATLGNSPTYKEGIDADGDGEPDLFRRPFRGSEADALLGTAAGPDVVIDDGVVEPPPATPPPPPPARAFLATLTEALVGSFPAPALKLNARISRIAVHAPPYLEVAGKWTRMGIATVSVTARIYSGEAEQVAAEQSVTVVLNEVPYSTPIFGPLHTCSDLTLGGPLAVHWGPITSYGTIWVEELPPMGIKRRIPSAPRPDRLWTDDPAEVESLATACEATGIDDPWVRLVSRHSLGGPPPIQTPPDPPDTWQPWASSDPDDCVDRSHGVAIHPLVLCPAYDYAFWKRLARSGAPETHYYVPAGGDQFREDGVGDPATFQQWTQASTGLHFFDTADGLAPRDADANGAFDNLVPTTISVVGAWRPRGLIYLNADRLEVTGLAPGSQATFRAPGEPFLDADNDRTFDPGETWINLSYGSNLDEPARFSANDGLVDQAGDPVPSRNSRGPAIVAPANLHGILFTSGELELSGPGTTVFGGIVAQGDVEIDGDTFGAGSGLYWDGSIGRDWPPPALGLPLVAISRWDPSP